MLLGAAKLSHSGFSFISQLYEGSVESKVDTFPGLAIGHPFFTSPSLPAQIPRSCQCMLMSATLSPEVERLTQMVLHNPMTLDLMAGTGTNADGTAANLGSGSGAWSQRTLLTIDRPICNGFIGCQALAWVVCVSTFLPKLKLLISGQGVRCLI